jgi:hypothetical protein
LNKLLVGKVIKSKCEIELHSDGTRLPLTLFLWLHPD